MKASEINNTDTKWVFLKKGTCSRTMFYILNREFGNPKEQEEEATDQLAGGILQQGYQCGLLWGTAFGVSNEANRLTSDNSKAIRLAVKSCQAINEAFESRAGSADCEDIINMNVSGKGGALKMLAKGKFIKCFNLADKWAPQAIKVAKKSLSEDISELPDNVRSCSSDIVRAMGGSDEEAAMVSGLAGGIGLSGKGCGALSAAIWLKTLRQVQEGKKVSYPNPEANKVLESFLAETDYKYECSEICQRKFDSIEDHTKYLEDGGCSKLMAVLAGD